VGTNKQHGSPAQYDLKENVGEERCENTAKGKTNVSLEKIPAHKSDKARNGRNEGSKEVGMMASKSLSVSITLGGGLKGTIHGAFMKNQNIGGFAVRAISFREVVARRGKNLSKKGEENHPKPSGHSGPESKLGKKGNCQGVRTPMIRAGKENRSAAPGCQRGKVLKPRPVLGEKKGTEGRSVVEGCRKLALGNRGREERETREKTTEGTEKWERSKDTNTSRTPNERPKSYVSDTSEKSNNWVGNQKEDRANR